MVTMVFSNIQGSRLDDLVDRMTDAELYALTVRMRGIHYDVDLGWTRNDYEYTKDTGQQVDALCDALEGEFKKRKLNHDMFIQSLEEA